MLNELKRRAAPMHTALFAVSAGNAVEVFCFSRMGQEHLLAYSLVLPLLLLLDAVGLAIGAGAASIYARADAARRPYVSLCSLIWAFGLGLILLSVFTFGWKLVHIGNPVADAYLRNWAPAAPFAVLNFTAYALLRAEDRSGIAAKGIILGAALQVVFTPLFIWGGLGVAALGFPGAGLAHSAAAILVSVGLVCTRAKPLCERRLPSLQRGAAGPSAEVGLALIALALPTAMSNMMVPIGAALLMILLRSSNPEYVAAYVLALRIESFCLMAFYAYSSVVGPIVVRQQQISRRHSLYPHLLACRDHCLKHGVYLAAGLVVLPLFLSYWLTSCPEVSPALHLYFWIVPSSYGAYGFVMLANGAFNGIGKPYYGLLISALRCCFLLWPLAWILNLLWAGAGIYVAIAVSNCLAAMLAQAFLKRVDLANASAQLQSTSPTPDNLKRNLL